MANKFVILSSFLSNFYYYFKFDYKIEFDMKNHISVLPKLVLEECGGFQLIWVQQVNLKTLKIWNWALIYSEMITPIRLLRPPPTAPPPPRRPLLSAITTITSSMSCYHENLLHETICTESSSVRSLHPRLP